MREKLKLNEEIWVWISDLHLNTIGPWDDFTHKRINKVNRLKNLKETADRVFAVGDLADCSESNFEDIYKRYRWFFNDDFYEKAKGNHDSELPYPNRIELPDYKILAIHGDIWDRLNKGIGHYLIGWPVTKIGKIAQRFGFTNIDRVVSVIGEGRYGSNERYYKRIRKWVDANPKYKGWLIIFCHTHRAQPDIVDLGNCLVLNTGTWTKENIDKITLIVNTEKKTWRLAA